MRSSAFGGSPVSRMPPGAAPAPHPETAGEGPTLHSCSHQGRWGQGARTAHGRPGKPNSVNATLAQNTIPPGTGFLLLPLPNLSVTGLPLVALPWS